MATETIRTASDTSPQGPADAGETLESPEVLDSPNDQDPAVRKPEPSTGWNKTKLDLENRTDCVLSIRARTGRVTLPPLGSARVEPGTIKLKDLDFASGANVLASSDPGQATQLTAGFVGWPLAVGAFCGLTASSNAMESWERVAWAAGAAVCVLFAVAMALVIFSKLQAAASLLVGVPRRLRELLYLGAVVLIVVAAPGAVLYFGSDVPGLLDQASSDHSRTVALIGIGVQFVSIVGASSLPVLLYFVFDREKLKTLREKFVRHIFRLDPAIRTRTDVDVKYGQLLDEAYGRRTEERLLPGARSPILLATGVMTLGWTIALLNTNAAGLGPSPSLTALLTPTPTAATYAFLGAYFFTLNHVMRGYVRGDLRPKTYAQVAARTVGVVVLAFVLEHLVRAAGGHASSPALLTLAFAAGIVPETVLIRLQDFLRAITRSRRSRRLIGRLTPIYETDPLTQLEGIDIYDRARLMDEGVTNVEGLAHHDLVELLLKTRIPASRLVDWVDQAILYIHCPRDEENDEAENARGESNSALRQQLRGYGIRTATDLEQAYAAACRRQNGGEEQLLAIVETHPGRPPVLRVILDAIADEDWMHNLRYWHAQKAVPRVLRIPERYVGIAAREAREPAAVLSSAPAEGHSAPEPSAIRPTTVAVN